MRKHLIAAAFVALAVVANWLASRWVVRVPLTDLYAPAGVFCIGGALVLRDWLQQLAGLRYSLVLVPVAGAASYLVGVTAGWTSLQRIAVASVCAFLVSETVEALLFAPVRRRTLTGAVALSATVGNVIDSFIFIWIAWSAIAFPGATHWGLFEGNFVGKLEAITVGVALTFGRRAVFPVAAPA